MNFCNKLKILRDMLVSLYSIYWCSDEDVQIMLKEAVFRISSSLLSEDVYRRSGRVFWFICLGRRLSEVFIMLSELMLRLDSVSELVERELCFSRKFFFLRRRLY